MAYVAESLPDVEPVSAGWIDAIANAGLYHVIEGCDVTYDPSDMTVDVAAGTVMHNGTEIAVSAQPNAITLVADATNPRWAWIAVDDTGDIDVVHGDAAAVAVDAPAVPSPGDRVLLALVYITAAATVANNLTNKLDKRIMWPAVTSQSRAEKSADETRSNTTLDNDDDLHLEMEANTNYSFELVFAYTAHASGRIKGAFDLPAGATMSAHATYLDNTTGLITTGALTNESSFSSAAGSTSTPLIIIIRGIVRCGATAGNLQWQYAQAASHATATTGLKGSVLKFL